MIEKVKRYDSITKFLKLKRNKSLFPSSFSSSSLTSPSSSNSSFFSSFLLKLNKKLSRFIIHPENDYKILFDFFLGLLILYTIIFIPLQLGLNIKYHSSNNLIDYLIDFLFGVDMLITSFTAYEEDGKLIQQISLIHQHYLHTWFLPDLISTIPFDSIISLLVQNFSSETLNTFKLIKAVRLFRLLKLLRILRLNRKLKDAKVIENIHPIIYQIIGLFTNIFFVSHLLACTYYYIAECGNDSSEDENSWKDCGHPNNSYSHYLASLY